MANDHPTIIQGGMGVAVSSWPLAKAVAETGDESIVGEVNKIVEASSSALQEAYMAAVRAQRAEAKARAFLAARLRRAVPVRSEG